MKIILLADVKSLGKKGDIVEVNDGYGKNFLIKKGLAELGTPSKINDNLQRKKADEARKEKERQDMLAMSKELNGKTVNVKIRSGENGKIFGSVTNKDVSDALLSAGYDIDKKKIMIKDAIKNLGVYEIEIKLYANISCKINIDVTAL
ncbi:MAG: 50S ribosomal protein L9 [Clostridia bacterium]|jgi:large subunit ribosomal protein L9|nr:50S ribosomal protein L9 [Clostridia bacterium]